MTTVNLISAAEAYAKTRLSPQRLCSMFCQIASAIADGDFKCAIKDFDYDDEKKRVRELLTKLGYKVEDGFCWRIECLWVSWDLDDGK